MAFVFGYGSLIEGHEQQVECRPEGCRRRFTVAMDNSVDDALAALDRRERNYVRCDVTELLREDLGSRVYAFVGRDDAKARFARAAQAGRAVVSRAYYEFVRDGFGRRGDAELQEFERSTDVPACPTVPLTRVDLP